MGVFKKKRCKKKRCKKERCKKERFGKRSFLKRYIFFSIKYIMARKHSRRRMSQSKSKTMRRMQRGGNLAGNPPSAWGWGLGTLGGGWNQFMNSLSLQPGGNLGAAQSNAIVPMGNVNAQTAQGNIGPNMTGNIPGQAGGRRRRRGRRSGSKRSGSKRGGNFGAVLSQAAVPGAIILMNNALGKRSRRGR
jgi:hypothetical protein